MSIDYRAYIKSPAWHKRARSAKKQAKGRCQVCYSDSELHAHHRTYERLGKELASDLVALCARCHGIFHRRLPGEISPDLAKAEWEAMFVEWGVYKWSEDEPVGLVYEHGKQSLMCHIGATPEWYDNGLRALATWLGV